MPDMVRVYRIVAHCEKKLPEKWRFSFVCLLPRHFVNAITFLTATAHEAASLAHSTARLT